MEEKSNLKEIARQLGSAGGNKTAQKYGTEYMKKISRLAVEARRIKAKKDNQI